MNCVSYLAKQNNNKIKKTAKNSDKCQNVAANPIRTSVTSVFSAKDISESSCILSCNFDIVAFWQRLLQFNCLVFGRTAHSTQDIKKTAKIPKNPRKTPKTSTRTASATGGGGGGAGGGATTSTKMASKRKASVLLHKVSLDVLKRSWIAIPLRKFTECYTPKNVTHERQLNSFVLSAVTV